MKRKSMVLLCLWQLLSPLLLVSALTVRKNTLRPGSALDFCYSTFWTQWKREMGSGWSGCTRWHSLIFKAYNHSQYAYSTLLLTVQLNATMSRRLPHYLTWNRFWNVRGGKGKNVPLDHHLEHLNNSLKSFLKNKAQTWRRKLLTGLADLLVS